MNKTVVTFFLVVMSYRGLTQGICYHAPVDSASLFKKYKTPPSQINCNHNLGEAVIPPNFYVQQLGFFCRQELKLQQAHIPLSFRLGSLEYCNWMEQKPGYR